MEKGTRAQENSQASQGAAETCQIDGNRQGQASPCRQKPPHVAQVLDCYPSSSRSSRRNLPVL